MSLTLMKLDRVTNKVIFSGAGHGNILVYRNKSGIVEEIPTGGMVLGISPDIPDSPGEIDIEVGDTLLIYTDGVTEATNSKLEAYEEERLIESFIKHQNCSTKEMLSKIYEDVKNFSSTAPQYEDITLVAMKRIS